jgi:hypothetical protein
VLDAIDLVAQEGDVLRGCFRTHQVNRKDKRRVERLRQKTLHAGSKATRPPSNEPLVTAAPADPEMPGVDSGPRFPNVEQQFRPGQSGNPDGYSRQRRIADALHRALNKDGLEDEVANTVIAMALGQKIANRTPDLMWFRELRDMVDGSPRYRERESPDTNHVAIDPAVAKRILAAADPRTIPELDEDGT